MKALTKARCAISLLRSRRGNPKNGLSGRVSSCGSGGSAKHSEQVFGALVQWLNTSLLSASRHPNHDMKLRLFPPCVVAHPCRTPVRLRLCALPDEKIHQFHLSRFGRSDALGGSDRFDSGTRRQYFHNARLAQLAEATALEAVRSEFESPGGYHLLFSFIRAMAEWSKATACKAVQSVRSNRTRASNFCVRSSMDKSASLRSWRLQVRVLPGVPYLIPRWPSGKAPDC